MSVGTTDFYYRTFLNLLGMGENDDPQLVAHRLTRIKDIILNYFPLSWLFRTTSKIAPTTLQASLTAAQVAKGLMAQSGDEAYPFLADNALGLSVPLEPRHISVTDAKYLYYIGIFEKSSVIEHAKHKSIWKYHDYIYNLCILHGIKTNVDFVFFVQQVRSSTELQKQVLRELFSHL
jgi:hypothetical protein